MKLFINEKQYYYFAGSGDDDDNCFDSSQYHEEIVPLGVFVTYYLNSNDYGIINYDYTEFKCSYFTIDEDTDDSVEVYGTKMPKSYKDTVMKKLASGNYEGVWIFYGFDEDGSDCYAEELTSSNCKDIAEEAFTIYYRNEWEDYTYTSSDLYESLCAAGNSKYDNYAPEDFDECEYGDDIAYFMRYTSDEEFASKGVILYR